MKDKNGREYASYARLKPGDKVQVDGDFTCIEPNGIREVEYADDGLWIKCGEGRHYLSGHLHFVDNDSVVGIYKIGQ